MQPKKIQNGKEKSCQASLHQVVGRYMLWRGGEGEKMKKGREKVTLFKLFKSFFFGQEKLGEKKRSDEERERKKSFSSFFFDTHVGLDPREH